MVRQISCMFALVTAETRESWGKPHVGHTESVCVSHLIPCHIHAASCGARMFELCVR